MASNPFRPVLGVAPPVLAGRETFLAEIRDGLTDNGIGRTTFLNGPVGSGRTVLLNAAAELGRSLGWRVIVEDGTRPGFVQRLIEDHLGEPLRGHDPDTYHDPYRQDLRGRLLALAPPRQPRKVVPGIMLLVDDIDQAAKAEISQFASAVQFGFIEDKEVAMVASGYARELNYRIFRADGAAPFMGKAHHVDLLAPIEPEDVAAALTGPLEAAGVTLEWEALAAAVWACDGFALMIQAVGWELWELGQPHITPDMVPAAVNAAAARVGPIIGVEMLPGGLSDDGRVEFPALGEYLKVSAWPRRDLPDPWA